MHIYSQDSQEKPNEKENSNMNYLQRLHEILPEANHIQSCRRFARPEMVEK